MTIDPENTAPPADVWTRAREDYLAGASAPVVAERHGLALRTLRRRAAEEGWRRTDDSSAGSVGPRSRNRDFFSREEAIKRIPELGAVEEAALCNRFLLLVRPDQQNLRRYAFEQASEAAALSRPAEALVWMRLVQALERTGDRIDREGPFFSEKDYIRAMNLRQAQIEADLDQAPGEA